MRLTSLTTTNYRTLEQITLEFSKNYCTISGQNNAGKSCVIRLLSSLFRVSGAFPWSASDTGFDYKEDKTQWVKQSPPIAIAYTLTLTKEEDPALISFIEKIASQTIEAPSCILTVSYEIAESDEFSVAVTIDGSPVDDKAAKEIDKRVKDSNLLFLYNSTTRHEEYYYGRGRRLLFYEFVMSADEKTALDEAGKHIERRLRRLSFPRFRGHARTHGSAVGVCHGKTEATVVFEGVQG